MQILKPKRPEEAGISIIIILVALAGFGLAMNYVSRNFDLARKQNKQVNDAITMANHIRFVDQVISDDSLCAVTDFLAGIKGWEKKKLDADKVLKDTGSFVNYTAIGGTAKFWPTTTYEVKRSNLMPDGSRVFGTAKVTSVVFVQPKDIDPVKTVAHGKTYWRIPVWVKEKGTFNGVPTIFHEGAIRTFVELDPDDNSRAQACYKDVSARALCLDAGGDFNSRAGLNKCLMPFHSPGQRQISSWQFVPYGGAPAGGGEGGSGTGGGGFGGGNGNGNVGGGIGR